MSVAAGPAPRQYSQPDSTTFNHGLATSSIATDAATAVLPRARLVVRNSPSSSQPVGLSSSASRQLCVDHHVQAEGRLAGRHVVGMSDWRSSSAGLAGLAGLLWPQTGICCTCNVATSLAQLQQSRPVANCSCCGLVLTSTGVLAGNLHEPGRLVCGILICICPVLSFPVLSCAGLCLQWRTGAWRPPSASD